MTPTKDLKMNLDAIFAPNPQCPVRPIGEGLVIMSPSGDTTHSLEDLGAFIWNHLDGKRDLQAVLQAIVDDYEIDPGTARSDLVHFVSQMSDAGLVLKT